MRLAVAPIALAVGLALLGAGCGSGGSPPEAADSPAGAEIRAGTSHERKIALEVRHYFVRNCALPGAIEKVPEEIRESPLFPAYKRDLEGAEAMCGQMASITVEGTRVTIRSETEAGARKAAGEAFCRLIQGSDVADFTPGHELQDLDGTTIEVCPARTD